MNTVIATYRVKSGAEAEFEALLEKHHPTLLSVGLATPEPATIYKGQDEPGEPVYYEIFTWKDEAAPGVAHDTPEVMAIWEPMGALCEERHGKPAMNFPHVALLNL